MQANSISECGSGEQGGCHFPARQQGPDNPLGLGARFFPPLFLPIYSRCQDSFPWTVFPISTLLPPVRTQHPGRAHNIQRPGKESRARIPPASAVTICSPREMWCLLLGSCAGKATSAPRRESGNFCRSGNLARRVRSNRCERVFLNGRLWQAGSRIFSSTYEYLYSLISADKRNSVLVRGRETRVGRARTGPASGRPRVPFPLRGSGVARLSLTVIALSLLPLLEFEGLVSQRLPP